MAESKRTFQSARMDKDIDDRLLPAGSYRDALNVSVDFSEDSNVGALENLKGNEIISNQEITGLSSSSNPNAKVIGSLAHPEESKIYYFVTGDVSDGIFEYDINGNTVKTVIIESSEAPPTVEQLTFTFQDANAQASVAINGDITVTAGRGEITSLTNNFNATVSSDTERKISVRIRVPADFSNSGDYVYGELTATQAAIAAPPATAVQILEPTSVGTTTVTLKGKYTADAAGLTEIGFYYAVTTGGASTVTTYSNKHVITELVGRGSANISSGAPLWTDPFDTVDKSDVTVIDGDGDIVAASDFDWNRISGPQPTSINFTGSTQPTLPITVAQTSTATTLTNALTAAQIVSNGTKVTLTGASITTPFTSDVTGLTSNSEYSAIAYVKNASGTTYSSVLNFKTEEILVTYNQLPDNKIFIFPTAGTHGESLSGWYPGYGDFLKSDGNYYLAAVASATSGNYSDYNDMTTGVTWAAPGAIGAVVSNTGNDNFGKTNSVNYGLFYANDGVYTITATKAGLTTGSVQLVKGSPSGTRYTSSFTLNFASTGVGTTPFVYAFDSDAVGSLHWNAAPAPTLSGSGGFKIGPFEQSFGKGAILIPLSTDNTVDYALGGQDAGDLGNFPNFDPEKITVSITGKTEGTDYDYYVMNESMSLWGSGLPVHPSGSATVPAILVEADPYVLNNGSASATHTLNITYNY